MKRNLYLSLIALHLLFFSPGASAQENKPSGDFKPSQTKALLMKGGDRREFSINLKKDDFVQIKWLANDDLDLSFALYSPSGEDVLEKIYADEDISIVAPDDGLYKLIVRLGETGLLDREKKIQGEQRITLQYTNVFKLPAGSVVSSFRRINGYDAKIYKTKGESGAFLFVIEKLGKLKALLKSGSTIGFYFSDDLAHTYSPAEKRSAALMKATPDKTGDGTPDVAVDYFSGGAHCCFDLHFFELGEEVRHVNPLATGDARTIAVAKNPKGGLRLETGDTSFAYWNISFAGSPIPSVLLEFQNGEFRPKFEAMKKPAPSLDVLQRKAREARAKMNAIPYRGESFAGMIDDGFAFEDAFWGEMLDLIYTGNEDLAWQYLDLVWRVDKPGKNLFVSDFKRQLSESRFWKMILEDGKDKN